MGEVIVDRDLTSKSRFLIIEKSVGWASTIATSGDLQANTPLELVRRPKSADRARCNPICTTAYDTIKHGHFGSECTDMVRYHYTRSTGSTPGSFERFVRAGNREAFKKRHKNQERTEAKYNVQKIHETEVSLQEFPAAGLDLIDPEAERRQNDLDTLLKDPVVKAWAMKSCYVNQSNQTTHYRDID
jgi:hypothetical protein